jgi:hypothetical protein
MPRQFGNGIPTKFKSKLQSNKKTQSKTKTKLKTDTQKPKIGKRQINNVYEVNNQIIL